jgi:hypothetical protein
MSGDVGCEPGGACAVAVTTAFVTEASAVATHPNSAFEVRVVDAAPATSS